MKNRTSMLLLLVLVLPVGAMAEPAADVEFVQPPAWVERGDRIHPLQAGMSVERDDVLLTGGRARVRLALADGSHMKIGADARVAAEELQAPAEAGGLFQGVLDVVRGAFRYTTGAFPGVTDRRRIDFRVGTVTAGIRGTDIWGKSQDDRDFVVLLDGRIDVGSHGRRVELEQPGTAYIQPRDEAAQVAVPIDGETIARFAAETEPLPGEAGITRDGVWTLHLDSLRDERWANAMRARYRGNGYPAVVGRATVDGSAWYRVSIHGIDTLEGARVLGRRLEGQYPALDGVWAERTGRGAGTESR